MANATLGVGCCCVLALLLVGAGAAGSGGSGGCPRKDLGETAEDCPWADVARTLAQAAAGGKTDVSADLAAVAPGLAAMIAKDKAAPGLIDLWGDSVNVDDNAKATIVDAAVLAAIGRLAGVKLEGPIVQAGLTHTYGYLLSNLMTPYGYKRARWVRPVLEDGFGLPRGTLGPTPAHGTLLANATALFGALAFRGDPARLAALKRATAGAAPAVVDLDLTDATVRRLKETVTVAGGAKGKPRPVELRTDVVRFPHAPADPKANAYLLIYSVVDAARPGARLVTGFPVDRAYADGVFEPLGKDLAVRVRYNGYVPGAQGKELKGERAAVAVGTTAPHEPVVLNDNDWPPFFFAGKAGEPPGLGKELLQLCLPATGRAGRFVEHAIKRMRRDMETGDLDINVYSYEPDREAFLLYGKEPIFHSDYRPVVRADSDIEITKISDFDGHRLGHLNGLTYSPEFKAYVEARRAAGTLDVTDSETSNLRKLVAGRFDIYVNSTPTVLWLAKVLGLSDKIKVLDFPVKRGDYFVTFSKASKRLSDPDKLAFLADVDGCLRRLKKDGTHQKLLTKYGQR